MEIICDSIRFHLPKRNLQLQTSPTLTKLESRDKINTILQSFGTSKKVDTKVTRVVKQVKPLKVVKASVTTMGARPPKEKEPDPKPVKITKPSKKYYYYDVHVRRRPFGIGRKRTTVIKYIDMNGNVNSFTTMPGKRIPKICALEGSVKATPTKGVSIIKKELCEILTPVPTIVKPKPKPIDLTKEQKDIIKNFKLPTPIKLATPIKFEIDQDELRRNIKNNLNFSKIKFNFPLNIGAPGATGDAGAARRYNVGERGIFKNRKTRPKPPNQKKSETR